MEWHAGIIRRKESRVVFTDNPLKDFERYDEEKEMALNKYPQCYFCGNHIFEGRYYVIDEEIACEDCLDQFWGKDVEDYGS